MEDAFDGGLKLLIKQDTSKKLALSPKGAFRFLEH